MADEYMVPSVICDDKESKKEVESFGVLYDFLKNKEGGYIKSQRLLFNSGISLLIVGAVLYILPIFITFIPFLGSFWFQMVSIAIIVGGAILFAVFFIRKPTFINIQKVYFRFRCATSHRR